MGKEIERKFLVADPQAAVSAAVVSERIAQGYLSAQKEATVRIRVRGHRGYITVKGMNRGVERNEWEYEIPLADAHEMLALSRTGVIDKTRHLVPFRGHTWEVDVFHGALAPLVLAEVELTDADEPVSLPLWLGEEVSSNPAYFNSSLAEKAKKSVT